MKKLPIFILAATLAGFSACSDNESATTSVTGIALDVPDLGLQAGQDYTLTATVLPEDASDKTVRWTSSDESKATVVNGKVTVTMSEEDVTTFEYVTITATAGNKADTCNLVIYPIPVPDNSNDTEVVINGVTWATRNVDESGTFAATPDAPGKLYQWNRKKAWAATDQASSDWDNTNATGSTWESSNDPSPEGWRVPTKAELETLLDENNVINLWTICVNVLPDQVIWNPLNPRYGRIFIDKRTNQSLFLPAVGYREGNNGALYEDNTMGEYWSNTADDDPKFAYKLGCSPSGSGVGIYYRYSGQSIRSVKK
ncbi:hypothetical protein AGMMS49525_14530 [Bacteroidia bacterium]|nr:hypothetical protein AGMMS49525_14530 [Bacteroidia bacterium]